MAEPRRFRARRCSSPPCALRFPVDEGSALGASCPLCGSETEFVDPTYPSYEARCRARSDVRVEVLLDNIRSLRNVGSVFRSADGAGVEHVHLCGFTPTPEHPRLAKTALGAETVVPWTRHPDATAAVARLVEEGSRLWVVDGGPASGSLFEPDTLKARPGGRIVLAFGHEISGVDPCLVRAADRVVCLPMLGLKGSLNVAVAMGIAAYVVRFARP